MHIIIRTIALIGAAAVAVGGAAPASAADPVEPKALSQLCVAHGGSFHVNTYDGVNWICSAPRYLGDFAAERSICDHVDGAFSRTQVIDGRASWFCHTDG